MSSTDIIINLDTDVKLFNHYDILLKIYKKLLGVEIWRSRFFEDEKVKFMITCTTELVSYRVY